MNNLLISLSVVLTMTVPLLVGIFLRLGKVVDQSFGSVANKLVYTVCLPLSLACSVYKSDFTGVAFPLNACALIVGMLVVGFALLIAIVPKIIKDLPRAGSLIQAIVRGNASIYGIPVAAALYGNDNIGVFCILIVIGVICFNVLSILTFSIVLSKKSDPWKILLTVVKNPSIWGILAGLAFNLIGIKVPSMLYDPIQALGKMVTPLCFVGIGASFSLASLRGNWKYLCTVCAGKLVILPIIAVLIAALLGFHDQVLLSFFVVFGMPCAVASYAMAERLGGDGPLAAQCVMCTTFASIGTVFLWIFALKSFMLI